jgi:hypothetical protein
MSGPPWRDSGVGRMSAGLGCHEGVEWAGNRRREIGVGGAEPESVASRFRGSMRALMLVVPGAENAAWASISGPDDEVVVKNL